MTIQLGTYGIWRRTADTTPDLAREVESLGFGSLWAGGSPPGDLAAIEELIAATSAITVATGIVNMWRDDAATVAESYHRIQSRYPNRFLLGVGVSHPESIAQYDSPYQTMDRYLDALSDEGVPKDHVILAALGPRALRLSAAKSAGTHPYFTTPRHTRMARELLGENVLLAPEQTVVVDTDLDRARTLAGAFASRYLSLVNYCNSLRREGWEESDLKNGGSDRLLAEVVLVGDPETVAAGIRGHIEAGADNVNIQVLGADPVAGYRSLAKELL
ncbi:MAG TPA: LLM class F420-dependent oxidoreductase [Acidimicrobiia bacterium]|nr:LLM class F420-dependent oxidoreductase [Acidimicrobiia bacterium]